MNGLSRTFRVGDWLTVSFHIWKKPTRYGWRSKFSVEINRWTRGEGA